MTLRHVNICWCIKFQYWIMYKDWPVISICCETSIEVLDLCTRFFDVLQRWIDLVLYQLINHNILALLSIRTYLSIKHTKHWFTFIGSSYSISFVDRRYHDTFLIAYISGTCINVDFLVSLSIIANRTIQFVSHKLNYSNVNTHNLCKFFIKCPWIGW